MIISLIFIKCFANIIIAIMSVRYVSRVQTLSVQTWVCACVDGAEFNLWKIVGFVRDSIWEEKLSILFFSLSFVFLLSTFEVMLLS